MIRRSISIVLLFCIFCIGIGVRVYRLNSHPAGFFCDEAATGYNAYTILKTGKDEYGNRLPLFFRSFDNYRPGLPFYLTIPFIQGFGLNEFATRLPAALFGSCTILIVYLLTLLLTKRRDAALIASLFLAISPWHIHFSRADALIYYPFFVCLGTAFFLKSLESKRMYWWACTALAFGLSLYTYYQAYLFVPIFTVILVILYWDSIKQKRVDALFGFILLIFCTLPLLYSLKTKPILNRFTQVAPSFAGKTAREILSGVGSTYLDHFSISFLFADGDIGYKTHFIQRYSVRGMGELYWMQLPLVLIGLIVGFKQKKLFLLLVSWLLLYPLGSSLAPFADGGGPFATRSIIGVIPFQILAAIGVISIVSWCKKRFLQYSVLIAIVLLSLLSFQQYMHKYFVEYPLYAQSFYGWQYGPRDIMKTFLEQQGEYDEYLIIGEFNAPDIFITFYDPTNICQNKCRIANVTDITNETNQFIAISPQSIQQIPQFPLIIHKTILYPNKQPAYYIGIVKK